LLAVGLAPSLALVKNGRPSRSGEILFGHGRESPVLSLRVDDPERASIARAAATASFGIMHAPAHSILGRELQS
jgi:hypothetical protein